MAKPWARYEVGFINHPKFKLLSGNAIGLWLEGKNHADEHLTDGFLPMGVIKGFRFYSKQTMTQLTTSIGPKDSSGESYAPLWQDCGNGVMMHDYLEHNPTGEVVRARQNNAEERRKQERERKRLWRERKAERRAAGNATVPAMSHGTETGQGRDSDADVLPLSRSNTDPDPDPEVPPYPPTGDWRAPNGAMGRGTLPRDHIRHAWCDPTFSRCVPPAVHAKLTNQLAPKHGGDRQRASGALLVWYPSVVANLPADAVIGDEFKFWQRHFDATFATKTAAESVGGRPRGCKHEPACADEATHTKLDMAERRRAS